MSVVKVLIWPDSVTGCITDWTTCFSSSFFILVSWWIMFLVFCLTWESAWSNKLVTPSHLLLHSVIFLRKLVILSRDLTLAETASKSVIVSSKLFHIFFTICLILLSNLVTISRIKLSPELSLEASSIFRFSSMSFNVLPSEFYWLKRQVKSSNLPRTVDFTTWVQSPTSCTLLW